MVSLAQFELKFRQKLWVVTNFGAFWKDQNLKSKPESKTKECANFKFEVKSCVK